MWRLRRLSKDELRKLSGYCAVAAALVFVVLIASIDTPATAATDTFSTPGVYAWNSGSAQAVRITVVGGGGGGAGDCYNGDWGSGAAGGSGGARVNQIVTVTPNTIYYVYVGAGGAGGLWNAFSCSSSSIPGVNGTYSAFNTTAAGATTASSIISTGGTRGVLGFVDTWGGGGNGGTPGGGRGAHATFYVNCTRGGNYGGTNATAYGAGGANVGDCVNGLPGQNGFVSITPVDAPVAISASPTSVNSGSPTTLSYISNNTRAGSCSITASPIASCPPTGTCWSDTTGAPAPTTLSHNGGPQSYPVPAGINTLFVKLWGAGGGEPNVAQPSEAGGGGFTSGMLSVVPAQSLPVVVGGGGISYPSTTMTPPYGGAGARGSTGMFSSGGGYTGIFTTSVSQPNALMIAGGGGGVSDGLGTPLGGNGGGSSGGNGAGSTQSGAGSGGTQSAGGAAGTGGNAVAGSGLQGGSGTTGAASGSGGGGGYFGGGGSNSMWGGGAGGGSGYCGGAVAGTCTTAAGTPGISAGVTDTDYPGSVGAKRQPGYVKIYPLVSHDAQIASGAITSDTTFTLTCTDYSGAVFSDQTTVTTAGAPSLSITANNSSGSVPVTYNNAATIRWSSSNVELNSCDVTYGSGTTFATGDNNATGVSTGNLTSNRTYTLACNNLAGSPVTPATVTVTVNNTCPANCPGPGGPSCTPISSNYSYNSSNNTCTLIDMCSDITGDQPSVPVPPCLNPATYPGVCLPTNYVWNGSTCVPASPVISTLTASPQRVNRGSNTTITWTGTNIPTGTDACSITTSPAVTPTGGRNVTSQSSTSGSAIVGKIQQQTTVRLTCGTATRATSVSIVPVPVER